MKKKRYILAFSLLCILSFKLNVFAACDYETQVKLATEAANVNMTYEIKKEIINIYTGEVAPEATEEDVDFDGDYAYQNYIYITLMNLTENIYIELTGTNGFSQNYYYEDSENGTIIINGGIGEEIVTYKALIKSTNNECSETSLRSLELITPKKNPYSDLMACQDVKEYYCEPFVTYEIDLNEGQVIDKAMEIKNNSNKENEEEKEKKWWEEWFENNPWFIPTVAGIIVLAGVATTVIIIKKRRSKVL